MSDFWKPTHDLFSGLIERPKMTEKLLLKPPFKYLFDIIMETIKKTGWGNGTSSIIKDYIQGRRPMLTSIPTEIKK